MPDAKLREQKKMQTYNRVQSVALKLFQESGYDATSVSDIANRAAISEATFYRYFPTKEDVVLQDSYDPMLLALLEAQPPEFNPIQAFRATFKQVLASLSSVEQQTQQERIVLITSEPKLRARMLDQISESMRLLVEPLAKRSGRSTNDFAVLTVVGAIMGVCIATLEVVKTNPQADFIELFDTGLAQIEPGLVL